MTVEIDNLIAVNAAANTGCFAGYTTNGSHTTNSYHERPGTPSPSGPIGLAVDFDAPGSDAAKLLACAQMFLGYASQLAELFHTPLGKWVKNGKVYPISQLDAHDVALHYNHVHVAIAKGTVLSVPNQPAPPAPAPQETADDMDALVITYPSGVKTVVTKDGAVKNAGTPFYGSIYSLKPQEKVDWTGCFALTAVDPTNPAAGYTLWNVAPSGAVEQYKFDSAFAKNHGV